MTGPNRPVCEQHGKVLYTSKRDARHAAVGALKSKRLRVYPCSEHPPKLHVTKESLRYQERRNRNG